MIRVPKNAILVEIEKIQENEYQFDSGVKLYINASYKPENHVRIYGTCVSLPDCLTKGGGDLIKWDDPYDFRHIDSIVPEVKIGDRVYFSYHIVHNGNIIEHDGKCYCGINYQHILCVVRDNEIIPIGGNLICEEYFGENAEMIEVDGHKIHAEVSKGGLISGIIKKASEMHAVVKIVGKPLKEDTMNFKPGDIVFHPKKFQFKNNIEGKEYIFLKYWDVMAVMEKV